VRIEVPLPVRACVRPDRLLSSSSTVTTTRGFLVFSAESRACVLYDNYLYAISASKCRLCTGLDCSTVCRVHGLYCPLLRVEGQEQQKTTPSSQIQQQQTNKAVESARIRRQVATVNTHLLVVELLKLYFIGSESGVPLRLHHAVLCRLCRHSCT
jgi:hypothetical protein